MSESADYSPGYWSGHDFTVARRRYDAHAGRSYADAVDKGKTAKDLLERSVATDSTCPVIIACDVTGSMQEWPATIFSKLPYLEHEAKTEYCGPDVEFCFAAVGDATCDQYPLQVRAFAKGLDMKKRLEEIVHEGGGGGQTTESYELAALYFCNNVSMPKAIRPILIFIGDEQPYDYVDRSLAKGAAAVTIQGGISTETVFADLQRKYSVYLVHKPYQEEHSSGDAMGPVTREVYETWAKLIGKDHIAYLSDPGRVVDVIFGILAKEADKIGYFRKEIEDRQKPAQVETVYKSLTTIHSGASVKKLSPGHSTLHKPGGGAKSKKLG